MTFGLILLGAIFLAVIALLAASFMSSVGLEVDQNRVKKSLAVMGMLLCVRGFISWFYIVLGLGLLVLSHPKINLPGFARRLDKSLENSDHPARYVP